MKRMQRAVLPALGALMFTSPPGALAQSAGAAATPHYRYVVLQRVTVAGPEEAFSINAANIIVGITDVGYVGQGALWTSQGRVTRLGAGSTSVFASSSARKITDRGTIAGQSAFDNSRPPSAATYASGKWTNVGTGYPDNTSFSAFQSANDDGLFVGIRSPFVPPPSEYQKFRTEAFAYRAGRFTTITLGGKNGQANDVNAAGVVVGHSELPNRTPHAFSWQNGKIADLGALFGSALSSDALGVNARGDAVGQVRFLGSRPDEAVLWSRGKARDLGRLGGSYGAQAFAINDAGAIVGRSSVDIGVDHGFLYQNGRMYDLNAITSGLPGGAIIEQGTAIARNGAIVGLVCLARCSSETPVSSGFLLEATR